MSESPTTEELRVEIIAVKRLLIECGTVIQNVKSLPRSLERTLCTTKLQEAVMWLGKDVKRINEANPEFCENPYPRPAVPGNCKKKENTKNIVKPALKLSDTVPKLEIEQYDDDDADGDLYVLRGWNELNRFGCLHSNTWKHAVDYAKHYGMQNADLLKVLVRSLLVENLSLHERLVKVPSGCCVPPTVVCPSDAVIAPGGSGRKKSERPETRSERTT